MADTNQCNLAAKHCVPCEGGVPAIAPDDARTMLDDIPGWTIAADGKQLSRKWTVKNFVEGMTFLQQVADVAEAEQHHPDLHLTGYRHIQIDLSTHAIGGLSENDFILAAKINQIPVREKSK